MAQGISWADLKKGEQMLAIEVKEGKYAVKSLCEKECHGAF
jgi:hypothetical protein